MLRQLLLVLSLLAFSTSFVPQQQLFAKDVCSLHYSIKLPPKVRVPIGRSVGDKDIIKYGFETEFTFDRMEGIVTHYAPAESFIARSDWNKMKAPERVEWLVKNKENVFKTLREAGGLELNTTDPALANFLPKHPILDSTGNIELVLDPVNTMEDWMFQVRYINEAIGVGSMQASIGVSHSAFFLKTINVEPEVSFKRNIGMLNFFHEHDVLQKLDNGYQRWLKDPTKQVAKSFDHEFLGPMTAMKHSTMSKTLKENTIGNRFEPKYMEKVAGYDSSFKYTGSTAYRPDIATKHEVIILEARDAHSSMDVLTDRVVRNTEALRIDRQIFEEVSELKPFDSVEDFNKLPGEVRTMLESFFKAKKKPNVAAEWYQGDQLLAVETFRNFAYPMRDWNTHIKLFSNKPNLGVKIDQAQKAYLEALIDIEQKYSSKTITKNEAVVLVQKEVAAFAPKSGLLNAFDEWYAQKMGPQMKEYKDIVSIYGAGQ